MMVRSPCPIHDVTHFGVTHYAMHPALSTNTNCTCNFMPKRPKRPKQAKRAKRAKREKEAARDARPHAFVNGLGCTGPLGWRNIIEYATAGECVRTYAQLCVALGPGAREKSNVFFVRRRKVMAFLSPEERVRVFSLVSKDAGRGAAALKRAAMFGKPLFAPGGAALVLADGSLALDRLEAASVRFPALEDVSVNLSGALSDREGFTDARRALILAKLCTCTFITRLHLSGNDIAVLPDAIGALTNLKELDLGHNQLTALPDSIGSLTALETLNLNNTSLTAVPDWIGSLTALHRLYLRDNILTAVPDWSRSLTALTELDLGHNQLTALPDSIGSLTALTELDLGNNELTTLPDSIGQLTKLTYLDVTNNSELNKSRPAMDLFKKLDGMGCHLERGWAWPDSP